MRIFEMNFKLKDMEPEEYWEAIYYEKMNFNKIFGGFVVYNNHFIEIPFCFNITFSFSMN